jgi:ribonuclease HI
MNNNWPQTWQKNNWKRGRNEKVMNPDLWEELLDLTKKHEVEFRWVPGHSGIVENERADRLSVMAAEEPDLPPDHGYERKNV